MLTRWFTVTVTSSGRALDLMPPEILGVVSLCCARGGGEREWTYDVDCYTGCHEVFVEKRFFGCFFSEEVFLHA